MDAVLSVRELTDRLRQTLELRFPYVWVKGEVTGLSRPLSGHVYFSLKEDDALLNCVWFRGQQARESFDPLTGEVWEDGPRPNPALLLENGQEMVCAGRLTVYGPRGAYQLVVELARETGQGRWNLAFEEMKRKLAALGYFDPARKRPLPARPGRVAVITAATGAAIQDFLRIAADRGLGAAIRVHHTPVQGEEAPSRIAAALDEANRQAWAEVLVLIRGGGSPQDLWAFNEERVAQAVFRSRLPVLTGVGHEIDHSIADFVADKAAATPSHTAQLLWPERGVYAQRIDDMETALRRTADRYLSRLARSLDQHGRALTLLSPLEKLKRQEERLAGIHRRLFLAAAVHLDRAGRDLEYRSAGLAFLESSFLLPFTHRLDNLAQRLAALDPRAPLKRGYALAWTAAGRPVRSVRDLGPGDAMTVEIRDGLIHAGVTGTTDGADRAD